MEAKFSSHERDDEDIESSSGKGEGTSVKDENPLKEIQKISQTETNRMRYCKVVLVLTIMLTGAAVSTAVFMSLSRRQEEESEDQFHLHANSIEDATNFYVTSIADAMNDLSEEITSYAITSGLTFPFVTMEHFEVNADHARKQSGAEIVTTLPLVKQEQAEAWSRYSVENIGWIDSSRAIAASGQENLDSALSEDKTIVPFIYRANETGGTIPSTSLPGFSPPPFKATLTNYDLFSSSDFYDLFQSMIQNKGPTLAAVSGLRSLSGVSITEADHERFHAKYVETGAGKDAFDHPHATMVVPIFDKFTREDDADIVGIIAAVVAFDRYLGNLLPDGISGIYVVLKNSCGQTYSYVLNGPKARFLGDGDLHEKDYEPFRVTIPFSFGTREDGDTSSKGSCEYTLYVYPSSEFMAKENDSVPVVFALLSTVVFLAMGSIFYVFDRLGERRNKKIVAVAAKSNAIVTSLFPSNVRRQLMQTSTAAGQLKGFLQDDGADPNSTGFPHESAPIAEIFPQTTVFIADICNFTAWSSARSPDKVFILLETLYSSFDEIAKRRKVYKVETIGDCYVAVAGLPEPRRDHAVTMARFAIDCLRTTGVVMADLEVKLGPDTRELNIRVGLHSGPCTAGVLRGERARFQLFGDTVNTAARMEQSGLEGRVQMSRETADQLIAHGKEHWIQKRENKVNCKGKGELDTFWLAVPSKVSDSGKSSTAVDETSSDGDNPGPNPKSAEDLSNPKIQSLIKWNVELLARALYSVVASRPPSARYRTGEAPVLESSGTLPVDEVAEVVTLPKHPVRQVTSLEKTRLPHKVMDQIHDFVSNVAAMYHENPFHNFSHASHVVMSVVKLLSRIVSPTEMDQMDESKANASNREEVLHDYSYGITSDPLTQFACIFSALIHDVDHRGVPNVQLVTEQTALAKHYKGKSVAEQTSIDLAWQLFMSDDCADFRKAICTDVSDLRRFRQLVVNAVMATDIADKDLKQLRNARWDKAFSESASSHADTATSSSVQRRDAVEDEYLIRNRKATIVMEHLIQASDVCHTMQHWHVYRKWNERLFAEQVLAYQQGRFTKDPATIWYEGEIGFFDFYIIPLAKKLKDCGVFGVSSDEYLNYALQNRREWEMRGREVVAELQTKYLGGKNLAAASW